VIAARYPTLEPYFSAWRDAYESAFEQQEYHLGSKTKIFPDVHVRVAWKVERFLLACWLALQADVKGVTFEPEGVVYPVENGKQADEGISDALRKFLGDMEAVLSAAT
jgi:hypothetical protein